jgi:hypothetical protein
MEMGGQLHGLIAIPPERGRERERERERKSTWYS